MKTALLTVKIDPVIKEQAQKIAGELGFSLGSVVDGLIRQFVRTREINLSLEEKPTQYMIDALKESEEDMKNGRFTSFKDPKEVLGYLDNLIKKKEYEEGNSFQPQV